MRAVAQGDEAMRSLGGSDFEIAGSASFATDVAQRVSKTIRDLVPLSAVDAAQWVDYWASVEMFAEGVRPRV